MRLIYPKERSLESQTRACAVTAYMNVCAPENASNEFPPEDGIEGVCQGLVDWRGSWTMWTQLDRQSRRGFDRRTRTGRWVASKLVFRVVGQLLVVGCIGAS
ncbi:hypothetical protein BDV93DRAFT_516167 [Ceratobasidium sp. AG-I]|nr:hypothetical protein BDV93DRAFT_516167 [Ceratobasidium sp. AG-I]